MSKTTRSPIRVLPDELAVKIAAGEVVERPASVIKELVENSLDAGATRIRVELADGGRKEILITDDGQGIPADEIPLALERHATSKITQLEDLWALRTMGFRGEALPSIAAISRFTIESRTADMPSGRKLYLEGGRVMQDAGVDSTSALNASPSGTRIAVQDLFFNVPARLKFLKSKSSEASFIRELLERVALCNPGVAFTLHSEGRKLLQLEAASVAERVSQVLEATAANIEAFESQFEDITVRGWLDRDNRAPNGALDRLARVPAKPFYSAPLPESQPVAATHQAPAPETTPGLFASDRVTYKTKDYVALSIGGLMAGFETPSEPLPKARVEDIAPAAPKPGFASLQYIGQLKNTYLMFQDTDGLVLIDQHAAHERINYEKIKAEFLKTGLRAQPLLVSAVVKCRADDVSLALEHTDAFSRLGFEFEAFGDNCLLVRAAPEGMRHDRASDLFRALLEEVRGSDSLELMTADPSRLSAKVERVLATSACHSSVRAGQALVLALVGSTASGKSDLALKLAREFGAEILSCDSLLVYRELTIGTAKPTEAELAEIPHHAVNLVELDEPFTAGDYVRYAQPVIERCVQLGKPLLIVGGTGFYLKALLCGVWDAPPTQPEFRERLEKEVKHLEKDERAQALHDRLAALDAPYAAKIMKNDVYRVIRALEIIEVTKSPVTTLLAAQKLQNPLSFEVPILGIKRAKIELDRRILDRTNAMFANGIVAETRELLGRYAATPDSSNIPRPFFCVGYNEVMKFLAASLTLPETRERILIATRQLAKKQLTFFNTFPRKIDWYALPAQDDEILSAARDVLRA
ncbi:MAG: tRNA (adenosine(37)-N6)-dimethylallyltransferase MiaA [Deltaproteobacteria bacterium]|nr:tRNA (adenosine(37)-N6)-dimethylallyltransferase MiaA [Deltaproteobacteria bacterium]